MKYTLTFFTILCAFSIFAQTPIIDIGIFNVPAGSNKLEIRIKPNQNLSPTLGGYTAGLFTIKFPTAYNATLTVLSTSYAYAQATSNPSVVEPNGVQGGFDYYIFSKASGSGGSFNSGQEYVIAVLQINSSTPGSGTFEIANDSWTQNNNGIYYQEYNTQEVNNIIYQQSTVAALPVKLVDFRATPNPDRTVKLNWTTESERDLFNYEIERSTDGHQFEPIGESIPKGGLGVTTNYDFYDLQPASGDNYYRLKMNFNDNSMEYSPIRKARIDDNGLSDFSIQPNPTSGPFTLFFYTEQEMDITISISNSNGLLLKTQKFSAEKGKNAINFNDVNLPAGTFNIAIEAPGQQKLVEQLVITKA